MAEFKCPLSRRMFLMAMAAPIAASCEFATIKGEVEDGAVFDLNDPEFEALQAEGGMACLSVGVVELILVRSGDEVIAFDRFCPHNLLDMGPCAENPLPAVWDAQAKRLTCRWHTSIFDENGDVVEGPSPSGIQRYLVNFDSASGLGEVLLEGMAE